MAHQLPHRNHAVVTGSENVSSSRLAGTPSTPTISDNKDSNAPGRLSYLEELNIGTLQNVQNLARITTPRHKHLKTKSAVTFLVDITTPDSLAEDLSNFHIYSPPEKDAVTEESNKITVRHSQEIVPVSPQTPRLQKSTHKAKHAHFALPEQLCDSVEDSNSNLTGMSGFPSVPFGNFDPRIDMRCL
jgi:hypothetical protein